MQLGHARKEQGDLAESEACYRRALAVDDGDPDTHLQLGHSLKLQGRRQEAIDAYLIALLRDPGLSAARRELEALGIADGDLAQVLRRSSLPPAGPVRGMATRIFGGTDVAAGDRARDARDWPNAAFHYARALEADPGNAPIWVQLGHARKEQGDVAGGEACYRRALAEDDSVADTHVQLGHALKLQGRREEALDAYFAALLRDPAFAAARRELYGLGLSSTDLVLALGRGSVQAARQPRPPRLPRALLTLNGLFNGDQRPDGNGPPVLLEHMVRLEPGAIGVYVDIQCVPANELPGNVMVTLAADGHVLDLVAQESSFGPHVYTWRGACASPGDYRFTLRGDLGAGALVRYAEISLLDPASPRIAPVPLFEELTAPSLGEIKNLIIGTTGVCNASCIHCPTNKLAHTARTSSDMPMALFRSLLEQIRDNRILVEGHISLGLFGDGLTDPHVVERARLLRTQFPDTPLHVNTNAAAYDPARHAALRDFATLVAVHIESLDPERYARLMQPFRLKNVLPKVHRILADMPGVAGITSPTHRENLGELAAIRDHFTGHGVRLPHFSRLSNRCSREDMYRELSLAPAAGTCNQFAAADLIVDWDGTVLLCCNDFQRQEPIGNLSTTPLLEILGGEKRRRLFDILRTGRWDQSATCRSCKFDCHHKIPELVRDRLASA